MGAMGIFYHRNDLRILQGREREGHRPEEPLHAAQGEGAASHCRCSILPLIAMRAGTATLKGEEGADWHLFYYDKLPDDYIAKDKAIDMGWLPQKGNLVKAIPGKMIGGNNILES